MKEYPRSNNKFKSQVRTCIQGTIILEQQQFKNAEKNDQVRRKIKDSIANDVKKTLMKKVLKLFTIAALCDNNEDKIAEIKKNNIKYAVTFLYAA